MYVRFVSFQETLACTKQKHREPILDLENDFKYLYFFCGCPRNPVHQIKTLDYWDIELADFFSDPLWVWLMVWHQFFEDLKKCSSSVDQQWLELVNLAPLSVYVEDLVWIIWRVRSKGVIQMDISIKGVAIHLVEDHIVRSKGVYQNVLVIYPPGN